MSDDEKDTEPLTGADAQESPRQEGAQAEPGSDAPVDAEPQTDGDAPDGEDLPDRVQFSIVFEDDLDEDGEDASAAAGADTSDVPADAAVEGPAIDLTALADDATVDATPMEALAGADAEGTPSADGGTTQAEDAATPTDTATSTGDTDMSDTSDTSDETSQPRRAADPSADVTAENARRVAETLDLARTEEDGEETAAPVEDASAAPAMTLASRIDRKLGRDREDDLLVKAYPTFALNKVTVTMRKSGRAVLDAAEMSCYAGHTAAVLVDPQDDEAHAAIAATLAGFRAPDSGAVMVRSANLAELEPLEVRGHRLGVITRRYAVRDDLDAVSAIVDAMEASNRTFLKPKPVIARELLARVGFDSPTSGVKAAALPDLDRRRLAIARALSCEAEVIIADEPLDGLTDDEDRAEILALLTDVARHGDPKRCVVIVTSDEELADATDRTYRF